MNNPVVPLVMAAILLVGAGAAGWLAANSGRSQDVSGEVEHRTALAGQPPEQIQDFQLTERSGEPFRSADMRGKVWVASFFFTTCPGPCTKLNHNIRSLAEEKELADVHWVSITVDPANDTLKALRDYAAGMQADGKNWYFCRGTMSTTKEISRRVFGLGVGFQSHTEYGVVVDRYGKIRDLYEITSTKQRKKLRAELIDCLAEEYQPAGEQAATEDESIDPREQPAADAEETEPTEPATAGDEL